MGAATAWQLARRGADVVVHEQFEADHAHRLEPRPLADRSPRVSRAGVGAARRRGARRLGRARAGERHAAPRAARPDRDCVAGRAHVRGRPRGGGDRALRSSRRTRRRRSASCCRRAGSRSTSRAAGSVLADDARHVFLEGLDVRYELARGRSRGARRGCRRRHRRLVGRPLLPRPAAQGDARDGRVLPAEDRPAVDRRARRAPRARDVLAPRSRARAQGRARITRARRRTRTRSASRIRARRADRRLGRASASRTPIRSRSLAETCLYTTTPDERFILERRGRIVIGSACSGHGFKFAPAVGKRLADLALGLD